MKSDTLMTTKMSRGERSKREDIAKAARCSGEEAAIVYHGYELGEANCGNCGRAFPPENPKEVGRVWCSTYETGKHAMQFCRRWEHENEVAAGIAPDWAVPYTKERL